MKRKPEELRMLDDPRKLMLARKYEKPAQVGRVLLNPAWLVDNSRALWEVVTPPADNDRLRLRAGWIVVTPPNSGVYTSEVDLGVGIEAYFLSSALVVRVIPFGDDDGASEAELPPKRVLVKPLRPSTGGKLWTPDARATRGSIEAAGEGVADVEIGDIVRFSEHVGVEYDVHGERWMLLHEDELLAKELSDE